MIHQLGSLVESADPMAFNLGILNPPDVFSNLSQLAKTYTQCQFIRNGVESQLVLFLIFYSFLTSLCFLISKFFIVTVS